MKAFFAFLFYLIVVGALSDRLGLGGGVRMPSFMFSGCLSERYSVGLYGGGAECHILSISVHGSVPSDPVVTGDLAGGDRHFYFAVLWHLELSQFGYSIGPHILEMDT